MTKKNHTIKDIAELAGVSKGTVDRVLNNRGRVSKKLQYKVGQILAEIDYRPNPVARNLKKNKTYRICVIIPDGDEDPYWLPAHEGIQEASEEFGPFGVLIEKYLYSPDDESTFIEKSIEALESLPDVLLIAPLFQQESIFILNLCKEKTVRVAFFNNHIKLLNNNTFIGQDHFQSGKIAANLMDKMIRDDAKIVIMHIEKDHHTKLMENGFRAYFHKKCNYIHIKTQNFKIENDIKFEKELAKFLKRNPKISGIFLTNSNANKVAKVLKQSKLNISVIGYDLLSENIDYLKTGEIDFLLHQKPKQQAKLSIVYFAEYYLFEKKIPSQKLLPIDIVTCENVNYFIE